MEITGKIIGKFLKEKISYDNNNNHEYFSKNIEL